MTYISLDKLITELSQWNERDKYYLNLLNITIENEANEKNWRWRKRTNYKYNVIVGTEIFGIKRSLADVYWTEPHCDNWRIKN